MLPAASHATRAMIRISQPNHHPARLDDASGNDEELPAERGITVDHVTVYRRV